jgi:hypothetical protein
MSEDPLIPGLKNVHRKPKRRRFQWPLRRRKPQPPAAPPTPPTGEEAGQREPH